ncbi:hypothetical protein [Novosphingobium sp.]|uniref:hypothetical protein n=1 Tax=Novosphingobium sp. TaxID=1874826 RepID=UPI003704739C
MTTPKRAPSKRTSAQENRIGAGVLVRLTLVGPGLSVLAARLACRAIRGRE